MKVLVYSFRTNPFLDQIEFHIAKPFVFGSLKNDIIQFEQKLLIDRLDFVLGIAKGPKGKSIVESQTVNRFNGSKNVLSGEIESLPLFVPEPIPQGMLVNRKASDSFCNWVMYRVSHVLTKHSLKSRHAFIHGHEYDLEKLSALF